MSEKPQSQTPCPGRCSSQVPEAQHASCPACSGSCASDALFCSHCGSSLCKVSGGSAGSPNPPNGAPAPAPSSPSSPPATCQDPTPADLPGTSLPPRAPDQRQPTCSCGSSLPPTAKFCPECGTQRTSHATVQQLVQLDKDGAVIATHPLSNEATLGKSEECDIVLTDDNYASRRHARIYRDNGQIVVEDTNSLNGTLIRVSRPFTLMPGDVLVIGAAQFRLESTMSDAC
jgi:hypothetical protein